MARGFFSSSFFFDGLSKVNSQHLFGGWLVGSADAVVIIITAP